MFDQISFNPTYHTYTLDGKRLKNVTSLVNEVKVPFDREGISARQAKEKGVPQEFILDEWEENGRIAREKGSKTHHYILQRLTGAMDDDPILALNETIPEMDSFDRFWQKAQANMEADQVEWVVGDVELGIAGTIDLVLFHRGTGLYHLFDWKTGKFEYRSEWNRFMLPPFDHLDDCHLNHYSLQLSLYKLILQRNTDITLGDSYIVHLTDDYQIAKAIDLTEQAEAWLIDRLT